MQNEFQIKNALKALDTSPFILWLCDKSMAKATLLHFTSKFNGELSVFSPERHSMPHFLSLCTEIPVFLFQLLFHTSLLHLFRPSFSFLWTTKTIVSAKGNALEKSWVQNSSTTRVHPFQGQGREHPLPSKGHCQLQCQWKPARISQLSVTRHWGSRVLLQRV